MKLGIFLVSQSAGNFTWWSQSLSVSCRLTWNEPWWSGWRSDVPIVDECLPFPLHLNPAVIEQWPARPLRRSTLRGIIPGLILVPCLVISTMAHMWFCERLVLSLTVHCNTKSSTTEKTFVVHLEETRTLPFGPRFHVVCFQWVTNGNESATVGGWRRRQQMLGCHNDWCCRRPLPFLLPHPHGLDLPLWWPSSPRSCGTRNWTTFSLSPSRRWALLDDHSLTAIYWFVHLFLVIIDQLLGIGYSRMISFDWWEHLSHTILSLAVACNFCLKYDYSGNNDDCVMRLINKSVNFDAEIIKSDGITQGYWFGFYYFRQLQLQECGLTCIHFI